MPLTIPTPTRSRTKNVHIRINTQKGGVNTLLDEARQPLEQSPGVTNMMQDQDGIWTTRWGTQYYGSAIAGEDDFDGAWEYIATDDSREIIAVGSTTGTVYKSTNNGDSWSSISGATMTAGNQCYFLQIDNELWITNSTDKLTVYDGSTLSRNTAITKPANLTATRDTGLSAGNYTYYYSVVALNEVGFTEGSTEASVTVNKSRDDWVAADDEGVDLDWDDTSGASRYEVYISDESGSLIYLASTTTSAYTDNGTATPNEYVEAPDANTTGGPELGSIELSNGRIWGVDAANKRIVFGGTGQYKKYFSYFYGGGYVELEKGGRDTPKAVKHYRTGSGQSVATVLTASPDGLGSIWQVAFDSITIGSEQITIPAPVKIVGSIGANSALAVINARDNIMFANKKGIFALKNRTQLFNVLATDEQSVNIRPSYRSINGSMIEQVSGYYYEGKVLFSCSISGTSNDTTFLYDLEQNNWTWKWDIGFKQFFEYTDDGDNTHLLAIRSDTNQLIEITDAVSTDLGQAYNTEWLSPIIHVDQKDHTQFAKIKEAFIELGRPKGTITFEVLGIEKNKAFSQIASRSISDSVSAVDFANALWGDYSFGEDSAVPTSYAQATVKKRLKINKKLNTIQFRVASTQANTEYTILSASAKGKIIPTRSPSSWRN